ncbi:NUDIX domain-containing protein [Streptomyces sp. NPDC051569]|uniref:NUDIX domain-containing protein n=1 Tax=Streptomyces sp. NPDC051569 TaxID=3365661 RepID=UPI0037A1610A
MSVEESDIVKEANTYLHAHPGETKALTPLFMAACDHTRLRTCHHAGSCPLVTAGAIVVDEQNRVLSLWNGRWALAEGSPDDQDDSLSDAALRVLEEFAGIYDVWAAPGEEGPLLIDVTEPAPEFGGARKRYGFRYLFRAHSDALSPVVAVGGQARWVPLDEISPLIRTRVLHRPAVSL